MLAGQLRELCLMPGVQFGQANLGPAMAHHVKMVTPIGGQVFRFERLTGRLQ